MQIRFFEFCVASSLCIPWNTGSIECSCERGPQTCPFHPDQLQQFFSCTLTLLHRNNFVDTFRVYPVNQSLRVWRSTRDLLAEIPVDTIPESSSIFQDLIILGRNFWYWVCNLFNCILSCSRSPFKVVAISFGGDMFTNVGVCTSLDSANCFSNFLRMLFKVALQGYFDSPTVGGTNVVIRTCSLEADCTF